MSDGTSTQPTPTVWPCLTYTDAPGIISQLVDLFGFEARIVVRDDTKPELVRHSQLTWPEGGGVMIGSADRADSEPSKQGVGCSTMYVVTDRVRELVVTARGVDGWTIVHELEAPDYGGENFTVRDPEGNLWSFGSYRGESA